ncbi:unnamed protein product [Angiostrongylus costaricensis]|uniref:ZP domain-containing protein n=1 Tax=Angiostrongylus costaricensis TaxID=334426 RepID=A0A0R3PH99_ANGCS|nr:unnamed protein product [Angiostrongylus costaricensis]
MHNTSLMDVPILDEFGCSLFPNILPHVEYPSDLNGGLLVNAFSLDVDQTAVFFECNVKLLLKLNGVCRRPLCPRVRFRRHITVFQRTTPDIQKRSRNLSKIGGA